MDYFDNIWRSFRIAWRHKYLWLIALFAGEGGGGGSFNFNTGSSPTTGSGGTANQPDLSAFQDQLTRFLSDYAGLLIALAVLWLVLVVVFFFLAAVCEGATIRSSAEHDADRPWGLRLAWRAGVRTIWPMVRFQLLLLALWLPLGIVIVGFVAAIIVAAVNDNGGLALGLGVVGALLLLPAAVYLIYLFLLQRLGSRALVLEQLAARSAIVRAHRLLFKRFGRTLLVWLLALAVALVVGIATSCMLAIVAIPIVLIAVVLAANNSAAIVPLIVLAVILFLPISLVIGGFLSAQSSTYWTLAFRRMEIDRRPATYLVPPAPPPASPA